MCVDPREGDLNVSKEKIIKGRVLVTTSPDCGSSPRKKLLRCPEKLLSHRAHNECEKWGEGSAAGEPASQEHVVITSQPTQK